MILIYLLIGFLLWGLIRVVWAIFKVGYTVNRMRRNIRQQFGQDRSGSQKGASPQSPPAPRRKKIDPSVAQDVVYEELQVSRVVVNIQSETDVRPTSPVDDIKWEDL